ncbi:hypothetical protein CEY12_07280 [Chryseobacterium sp. T16E-39]|nr:hypothetical protein CEY12_07280 [Chryseobacterium sp. T16E-39]
MQEYQKVFANLDTSTFAKPQVFVGQNPMQLVIAIVFLNNKIESLLMRDFLFSLFLIIDIQNSFIKKNK